MRNQKLRLLHETFTSGFELSKFKRFTIEFFNDPETMPESRHTGIWKEFSNHIAAYYTIAKYIDCNGDSLIVLAVELCKSHSIDRARSMQRNFISKVLDKEGYDAAIVAFYTPDSSSWRLSFVKLDYSISKEGLDLELTPAKRYSYLLGVNEPNVTAEKQLLPIFKDDNHNPAISDIEEAFSVEKVTKAFFILYKSKYLDLKEYLLKDSMFNDECINLGLNKDEFAEQFSKKLMGQLAFLYFLQKKGWLGVRIMPEMQEFEADEFSKLYDSLDNSHNSMPWGSGDKKFIRYIYDHCSDKTDDNFFNDFLEPFFYNGLNKRRKNNYFRLFNCKIPFLNGGLFEPLEGYHWDKTDIEIPNEIFSNPNAKNEREEGILDIFERFNFTMNEEEPFEKEVAIDPEMLGKIFENLLEVSDRKSKGAFYTPREIVHYMCQESLINYLVNEADVPYDDIKEFILYGELIRDEDNRKGVGREKEFKIKPSIHNKIARIDNALKDVRVADPAVGSGAFPLGMLNEIVKARINITEYIIRLKREGHFKNHTESEIRKARTPYNMKLYAIENCIFAVDIEPSAIDIAKLRFWLSIVVDQELEDSEEPHALPNLDMNLHVGNSLIDEYEGIQLFDKSIVFKDNDSERDLILEQTKLFFNSDTILEEIFMLQKRYFSENDEDRKKGIRNEIAYKQDQLIRHKLDEEGNKRALEKYENIRNDKSKPYFIWELEFARVFKEKGGFDIVIGNPPYGIINKKQNKHTSLMANKYEMKYYKENVIYKASLGGMINIFRLFVCKSYYLLKKSGGFSLIFPMAFLGDFTSSKLRRFIIEKSYINYIEAFPERDDANRRVFRGAKMSVCILGITRRELNSDSIPLRIHNDKYVDDSKRFANISIESIRKTDEKNYTIPIVNDKEANLITKIVQNGCKIKDVSKCFTGEIDMTLNKDQISNDATKVKLIRGAQVQRYEIRDIISQGEIIYLNKDKYLAKNKSKKSKHHMKKRIVMQGITGVNEKTRLKMAILDDDVFCANSVNYILQPTGISNITLEYILACLNSKLYNWFFKKFSTNSNVNGYEVDNLPVKLEKTFIIKLTKKIEELLELKEHNHSTQRLENEVDILIYELFNLSPEEIEIIEETYSN